jgi:hypothetical protein
MFSEIWALVTGTAPLARKADLSGYQIFCVKGEVFPGIVPSEGCSVTGIILEDVSDATLARLDAYEGSVYRRILEKVDGLECWVYIVPGTFSHILSDERWTANDFSRDHLRGFVSRLKRGF